MWDAHTPAGGGASKFAWYIQGWLVKTLSTLLVGMALGQTERISPTHRRKRHLGWTKNTPPYLGVTKTAAFAKQFKFSTIHADYPQFFATYPQVCVVFAILVL